MLITTRNTFHIWQANLHHCSVVICLDSADLRAESWRVKNRKLSLSVSHHPALYKLAHKAWTQSVLTQDLIIQIHTSCIHLLVVLFFFVKLSNKLATSLVGYCGWLILAAVAPHLDLQVVIDWSQSFQHHLFHEKEFCFASFWSGTLNIKR